MVRSRVKANLAICLLPFFALLCSVSERERQRERERRGERGRGKRKKEEKKERGKGQLGILQELDTSTQKKFEVGIKQNFVNYSQ